MAAKSMPRMAMLRRQPTAGSLGVALWSVMHAASEGRRPILAGRLLPPWPAAAIRSYRR